MNKKSARATTVACSFVAAMQLNLAAHAHAPVVNHNWSMPVHVLPHTARGSVAVSTGPKLHTLQTSQFQHFLISGSSSLTKSGFAVTPTARTLATGRFHYGRSH